MVWLSDDVAQAVDFTDFQRWRAITLRLAAASLYARLLAI